MDTQGDSHMKIALVDVDSHHWPNLALMKLSAWHKQRGDAVEWWRESGEYDRAYMSKIFDETYSPAVREPQNTAEIVKGGTGYGLDNFLPEEIEHIYPDYCLYPDLTRDTAYGFLTRGCVRGCRYCVVPEKEGNQSRKVADLSEWWRGQRNIRLLDPNLLACKDHEELLIQLAECHASVDFSQGLDIRLITPENAALLNKVHTKRLHFAWDDPTVDLTGFFQRFTELSRIRDHRRKAVYVLTNYSSTHEQDLYRVTTLRRMGYDPYVMVYNRPSAPKITRQLQRWVNNKRIFNVVENFEDYREGQKKRSTA